ncbi:MAG: Disulfide bond formation protein B [Wolbachia endosymbiont of Ctenocephalides orientis wCori]|nr:MAG: Disulfide bond formation protein B [Wolbachia endosymbiont of Ctenocephalides orientis wCori]
MKTSADKFNKLDKFQLSCLLFTFASLLALVISYTLQYSFHEEPCILANYQRHLHLFVLLFALLFLANKYREILVYSMFVSYIVGSSIAFYHAGLALDIFPDIFNGTKNKE